MTAHNKYELMKQYLKELGSVAIAFSGGVDSTFLLKAAHDVLGDQVIAVTSRSCLFPEREMKEATEFCEGEGIRHFVIDSKELQIEGFAHNPPNRCYLCKSELFRKTLAVAQEQGIAHVAEGSNLDDIKDYRPGMAALEELDIKSPLRHVELSKQEIRELSREIGLSTWEKQPFSCLATRFPYGESITEQRLEMLGKAEQFLLDIGFRQVRVRYHQNLARIETDENGFRLLEKKELRESIYNAFRQIGFTYVASDLLGYRAGSMDEAIDLP